MPNDTHRRLHRTWGGWRKGIRSSSNRGCTVTFDYGERGFRTLVAPSFRVACEMAAERWGADWVGEPTYSTPETIYNDLTGWTKATHGQDFGANTADVLERNRFRRTAGRLLPKPKGTR